MILVTPRIVKSVSCVTRISHESHFVWQAQYLLKLEVVAPRIVNTVSCGKVLSSTGVVLCSTE